MDLNSADAIYGAESYTATKLVANAPVSSVKLASVNGNYPLWHIAYRTTEGAVASPSLLEDKQALTHCCAARLATQVLRLYLTFPLLAQSAVGWGTAASICLSPFATLH